MISRFSRTTLCCFLIFAASTVLKAQVASNWITVSVPSTIEGATYTLEKSTDLATWTAAPECPSFTGDSLPHVAICDPGSSDNIFFRWRVDGVLDPDQLATLPALTVDTGDPTVDSDGDGFVDPVETALGTSPQDPDSNPNASGWVYLQLEGAFAGAHDSAITTRISESPDETWSMTHSWSVGTNTGHEEDTKSTNELPGLLSIPSAETAPYGDWGGVEIPFLDAYLNPTFVTALIENRSVSGTGWVDHSWYGEWAEFRLRSNIPMNQVAERTYLIVDTIYDVIAGGVGAILGPNPDVQSMDCAQLLLPANASSSNVYILPVAAGANKSHRISIHPTYVKEVGFSGDDYHEMTSDDFAQDDELNITAGDYYNTPHYRDSDGSFADVAGVGLNRRWDVYDHHNYPVCFTCSTSTTPRKMKLSAKFVIKGLSDIGSPSVKISIPLTPQGLQLDETSTSQSSDEVLMAATDTSSAHPNPTTIQFHNVDDSTAYNIKWKIKVGGNGGWVDFKTTKHTVYFVRGATPDQAGSSADQPVDYFRESIPNIGCRIADGQSVTISEQTLVDTLFTEFGNRSVARAQPSSGSKRKDASGNTEAMIYRHLDGDGFFSKDLLGQSAVPSAGRCGAWGELFQRVLACQGVSCSAISITAPSYVPSSYVEALMVGPTAWNSSTAGSVTTLTKNTANALACQGVAGTKDDAMAYADHYLVFYVQRPLTDNWNSSYGTVYDPSYGEVKTDLGTWKNDALYGYAIVVSSAFQLTNLASAIDPKFLGRRINN